MHLVLHLCIDIQAHTEFFMPSEVSVDTSEVADDLSDVPDNPSGVPEMFPLPLNAYFVIVTIS
jgi:hypothetical protein